MRLSLWLLASIVGIVGSLVSASGILWQGALGSAVMYFSMYTMLALLYLAPAFLALHRNHPNMAAIAVLNVLSGWTLVGWIGALVWAFTQVSNSPLTQPLSGILSSRYLAVRAIAVAMSAFGLLLVGFGLQKFGSNWALLHYLGQAYGEPWMPYWPGWVPILIGIAVIFSSFALLRKSRFFTSSVGHA